jgi:uncharacterized protein (TIGR03118 family)
MYGLMMPRIASRNVLRGHMTRGPATRRARPRVEALETRQLLSGATPYLQTNLVSNVASLAQIQDSSLINPWGVSFSPQSPFWVSNQGTNTSTLYSVTSSGISKLGLTVSIPTTTAGPQGPTGQVHNSTSSFLVGGSPAFFIFANLNGTISAWNQTAGTMAQVEWTTPGAIYTGLATASTSSGDFLYAANNATGTIDVFDGTFAPHSLGAGAFVDPNLPRRLAPFNIELMNGELFVTYAPIGHANQVAAKPGQGVVAVFTTSGQFVTQLISHNHLASPWGMVMAPAGFGSFSGDLLVGNFAYKDSEINAFNPSTGKFIGTLKDASGHIIFNPGLWTLAFGNGASGGLSNTLYFTAGIHGETAGLFGSLQAIPSTSTSAPIVTNLSSAAFQSVTTIPSNGDLNPYGVAFVPSGFHSGGMLKPGDILVSNFNNAATNQNGTGTTIVDIKPNGSQKLFYQGPSTFAQMGLDTALGILKSGFVIVGNLPATYDSMGNPTTVGPGSLLILDSNGHVVTTLTDSTLLNGPWDMTVNDQGNKAQLFVSNALSGTVTRIDLTIHKGMPSVTSMTQIASGYSHRIDPTVLAFGPTGLAYDPKRDVLYVASTADNEIFAISDAKKRSSDAGTGTVIYQDNTHLHGPLGLALAPNGNLIAANGDGINTDPTQPSELVEFTPGGQFVGQFSINTNVNAPFGLAVTNDGGILRLAAVDDDKTTLDIWTFQTSNKNH